MMTPREVAELLKRINAYDNRKIDDSGTFAAWLTAAGTGRWTFEAACRAVDEFFSMPADPTKPAPWLEPRHVTFLIRKPRTGPAPVAELRADPVRGLPPAGAGSSPDHRAACVAAVNDQLERQLGRHSRVKARRPWHDGPVERPVREIEPAQVRAIAANLERAAGSIARRFDAEAV